MPHAEFHVPFPKRDNPDLARVRNHNLDWLTHHGLLRDDADRRQYLTADIADFCSMAHADAADDDLDAVVDAWSWTVFPDDLFDGPTGRDPGAVAALCRRFAAIIDDWPHTRPDPAQPMETALHDLWGRLTRPMPEPWVRHRARLWTDFILSMITEAGHRDDGHPPRLADYLRTRRSSLAAWPTLLIERTGRFHVPDTVTGHPAWHPLHELWIDALAHINDVYSLEKDESFGDVNNIVLVLQHEQRLTRDRAIERVRELVRDKTSRYRHARETLLSGTAPAGREAAERYLTGMGDYASANYFFSQHVKRYSPHGGTVTERLSYIQHLKP